ncbi:hypothetical protein [Microbacterium halophytorum]|uniref:hypothetical protein n=1 Tax=Microbacterium halophytorum TaxID=2067568 RepID=UPI000CFC8149|nr:hypothetical protein [Microbacterium halophytorum]
MIESTGLMEQDDLYPPNTADAPFGTSCPAGTPSPAETLMGMQDGPDEERLYSGQRGMMLIRG